MAIQEHHTIAVLELGTAKDASDLQKNGTLSETKRAFEFMTEACSVDEKVDQFMKNIQENADGDYVVIYTSSSPKKTVCDRLTLHMMKRLLKYSVHSLLNDTFSNAVPPSTTMHRFLRNTNFSPLASLWQLL